MNLAVVPFVDSHNRANTSHSFYQQTRMGSGAAGSGFRGGDFGSPNGLARVAAVAVAAVARRNFRPRWRQLRARDPRRGANTV